MKQKNIINKFMITFIVLALTINAYSADRGFNKANSDISNAYTGSTFSEVWNILLSDPYVELPQKKSD